MPAEQGVNMAIGKDLLLRLQNTSISQYWLQRTVNIFSTAQNTNRYTLFLALLILRLVVQKSGYYYPSPIFIIRKENHLLNVWVDLPIENFRNDSEFEIFLSEIYNKFAVECDWNYEFSRIRSKFGFWKKSGFL